jgi:hypothetical protein
VLEDSTKTTHRKYAPKAFNNACKRAKIENCTLKICRKTNASRLVQVGAVTRCLQAAWVMRR